MTTGRINQVAMLARRSFIVLPLFRAVKLQSAFAYLPTRSPALTSKASMRMGEIAYQLLIVALKFKATHQSITGHTEAQHRPL